MKKLILLIALLLARQTPATFSIVQQQHSSCTSCSPTSITVTSTGSGHLLTIVMTAYNGQTGSIIAPTTGCGGSWTVDTNSAVNSGSTFGRVTIAYCLSSTSGVTSIAFTVDASNNYRYHFLEYSFTGSSVSYATSNHVINTASNTQVGVTLSGLSGNNVILRCSMEPVNVTNTITAPYTIELNVSGSGATAATADSLNTASGTGPTWTLGASSSAMIEGAIAFNEAGGGGPPATMPPVVL
jgi:hypothetical protein